MDVVFNISKGEAAYWGSLPGTNDALVAVPLELAGLVDDATMEDYDTLAAILAGASNEQTDVGRITLTGVTVTTNDTDNRKEIDSLPIEWPDPPASDAVGAVVICYDPDTTGGDDSTLRPLTMQHVNWTPDGNAFTLNVADFFRAS